MRNKDLDWLQGLAEQATDLMPDLMMRGDDTIVYAETQEPIAADALVRDLFKARQAVLALRNTLREQPRRKSTKTDATD